MDSTYPEFVPEEDRKVLDAVLCLTEVEADLMWAVNHNPKGASKKLMNEEEATVKRLLKALGYTDRDQVKALTEYLIKRLE